MRRDLLVEVVFPIHALGDGLDDEIALFQPGEIVFVVGGLDERGIVLVGERRRVQLFEVLDRAEHDLVLRPVLGGQIEQDDRYLGVDAVGGDLRPHDSRAEHGDFLHDEIFHGCLHSGILRR
jgi:hypothetical protein